MEHSLYELKGNINDKIKSEKKMKELYLDYLFVNSLEIIFIVNAVKE